MKRRLVVAIPIVLVVVLAAAVTNIFPFRSMLAAERAIDHELEVLDATIEENEALVAERDALLTDGEVERVAREKYGYVKPGEQPYVVVVPREPVAEEAEDEEPDEPPLWFDGILDFLTGRDLTDG